MKLNSGDADIHVQGNGLMAVDNEVVSGVPVTV